MSTWAKYQPDRRRLRQARKAIPDVTWRLPLGYCQNPGELVLSEGRNYKLFFVLLKANPILAMAPRDGCVRKSVALGQGGPSDEHKYSNIRIFEGNGPQILFVFVFVPFPQYKYIRIFIHRFLDNRIYSNICS